MSIRDINKSKAEYIISKIADMSDIQSNINDCITNTELRRCLCNTDKLITTEEQTYLDILCSYMNCSGNTKYYQNSTYGVLKHILSQYGDKEKVCIVNMAHYFNPGGSFLEGSWTQEESLCHVSTLYSILSRLPVYYERQEAYDIPPEYYSEIIYSPDVTFFIDGFDTKVNVDVISCTPPNMKRIGLRRDVAERVLKERLEAVYMLPAIKGVKHLIMCAWGSGGFNAPKNVIVNVINEVNTKYSKLYDTVEFALPNVGYYDILSEKPR